MGGSCLQIDCWRSSCVISGFQRVLNEICSLLWCCAAHIGCWLPTFRDNLAVLEDGTRRFSWNADNYKSSLRNIPEEHGSHLKVSLFALNDSFGSYDDACSKPWITSGSFRGYPRHNFNPMRSFWAINSYTAKINWNGCRGVNAWGAVIDHIGPIRIYYIIATYITAYSEGKTRQCPCSLSEGIEGRRDIAPLILGLGARRRSVSSSSQTALLPGKKPRTLWTGDWVGPRACLDDLSTGKKQFFLLGFEARIVQSCTWSLYGNHTSGGQCVEV